MNASWTRYLPDIIRVRLEGREQLQKAAGNAGWLFFDNILRMGIGLLVNAWLTRYLGPEQFGTLSYARAFLLLFSPLAALGLEGIVVRDIARAPEQRDEILGSAFLLRILGALCAICCAIFSIMLLRPEDRLMHLLVWVCSLGTLFQSIGVIDFYFQSQVKSKFSVYARSATFVIANLIKLVLIFRHAPLVAFAWVGVVEIILNSLGLVLAYRANHLKVTEWRSTRVMAIKLLRDCWPLLFSDLLILAYMRMDKIIVGEMAGNTELGVYAVAAMLAEALYFIPGTVASTVFPYIVRAKDVSEELFYERLQHFYNLMTLLAYAVALGGTVTAAWLIPLLFGEAFAPAVPMFVGLVWAGVFISLMMARSYFLTAMNWTRLHFVLDLLGCIANISLNFLLIPRYGAMGAVIASLISYFFVTYLLCFAFKPLYRTGAMMTKALLYPKVWGTHVR
jgi:O-antigen/teichoic acid export membrane protein